MKVPPFRSINSLKRAGLLVVLSATALFAMTPGIPVTVVLQNGLDGYDGTEDTWISDFFRPERGNTKSNLSFGSHAELCVAERGPVGENTRALIRFDLSRVRGKIVGAELVLTKSAQSPNGEGFYNQTINLFRVSSANRDWQAGTSSHKPEADVAVWNFRADPSVPWGGEAGLSTEGVDYESVELSSAITGVDLKTPVTWVFADAAFLNDWAAHPEQNAGFLLKEVNPLKNGGDRFYSADAKEAEFRPKLILQIEPDASGTVGLEQSHPPIPVKFSLKEPRIVTLAIDDAQGQRVRNLVSDTEFPAGDHVVWWDGLDESGKRDVSPRGAYKIDGKLVAPGEYRVRGLTRKPFEVVFEFAPYNPGNPPWSVWKDGTSGWLADHSPPADVLFMPGAEPQVLIGSHVVEGGSALAWVNLEGRKLRGMGWLGGGHWTGASSLARDLGDRPLAQNELYAGTTHADKAKNRVELRLIGIRNQENQVILIHPFPARPEDPSHETLVGGLAAWNGMIFATLPTRNELFVVDAAAGKVLKTFSVDRIGGVTFDAKGRLLALSGNQVKRFEVPLSIEAMTALEKLPEPQTVVASGLDEPQRIALDSEGNLFVSDWGKSHNVKVFSADGKLLRTIGKAGVPSVGEYDPLRMNHPNGLTLTSDGHLWVAEKDNAPRRVSVWKLDGTFARAFYGNVQYGGGGQIDPRDKTRYYYATTRGYGMEFRLNWEAGTDELVRVISRPEKSAKPENTGGPERPIYAFDRQFMTNDQSDWLMGTNVGRLWVMREGIAVPVAMAGMADQWPQFKQEPFRSLLPAVDGKTTEHFREWLFAWSDLNGDAEVQPKEITLKHLPEKSRRAWINPVVVEENLDLMIGNGFRLSPSGIDKNGVPLFDAAVAVSIFDPTERTRFQATQAGSDWTVQIGAPIVGWKNGRTVWTYPCRWPSLTAMYGDALEEPTPGQIVGLTRFSGPPIRMAGSSVGPLLATNANSGCLSLLTADGLYAGTIGKENRIGIPVRSTPKVWRGMSMNENTFGEEHFFINLCQTSDGKVYVTTGFGIVRVDGLDSIERLPDQSLKVTADQIRHAAEYGLSADSGPKLAKRLKPLSVPIRPQAPTVDGKLDDWAGADWALVAPAKKNYPDSAIKVASTIAGGRLYVAFQTGEGDLFRSNGGGDLETLFKSGGALDLMLGTDPKADPKRTQPVAGDVRLLITEVDKRPVAALYRAVVPGTKKPVAFSSPWRTVTLDQVADVSALVELAKTSVPGKTGFYEFSIPLVTLGLSPQPGQKLRADVGMLLGKDGKTIERLYWSNKASGLVADVPGEAMLTPPLWGEWEIVAPAK